MAGEMHISEVTKENFPLHFAIAEAFGGTVHPFDQYQGPYIMIGAKDITAGSAPYAMPLPTRITGGHRLWITSDDGEVVQVYNESNEKVSDGFLLTYKNDIDGRTAIVAAAEVTGLEVKQCPIGDDKEKHGNA